MVDATKICKSYICQYITDLKYSRSVTKDFDRHCAFLLLGCISRPDANVDEPIETMIAEYNRALEEIIDNYDELDIDRILDVMSEIICECNDRILDARCFDGRRNSRR